MGALLGAAMGIGLALMMESVQASKTVAAPERERAAVLAASPPSSQPTASPAASSPDPGTDNVSAGGQRALAADQHDEKADKKSDGPRDKPSKAKGKPGKER